MLPIATLLTIIQPSSSERVLQQALAWSTVLKARLEVLLLLPLESEDESPAPLWLASGVAKASYGADWRAVHSDDPAESVLQEAERLEAGLVIVDMQEGRTQLKSLLRQLPCPLLLTQQDHSPLQFAAAIGVGAEDVPHRQLNQSALAHLTQLAQCFGGQTRVLSALPNPAELVPLLGDVYAASYTGTELESSYRKGLEETMSGYGLTAGQLHVAPGRPNVVLPELVQREAIDCLLIGTVARQGFSAFWLGNTAEDVLPHVSCDVLVLRPGN